MPFDALRHVVLCWIIAHDSLLFYVRSYSEDANVVRVVEVVAEIEFGEPEGYEEAGVVCA